MRDAEECSRMRNFSKENECAPQNCTFERAESRAGKRSNCFGRNFASKAIFFYFFLCALLILLVCFGYFQPWNLYSGEIDSKEHAEMKKEIEILDKKADTASQMLPGRSEVVIPDALRDEMLNGEKIRIAVVNEMHVDLPQMPNVNTFVVKEHDIIDLLRKSDTCAALKDIKDLSTISIDDFQQVINAQSTNQDSYANKLEIALGLNSKQHKSALNKEMNYISNYPETMKKLIKKWKDSLIQFGKSIDMRMNKIFITILVTDILLLYIPSAFVLIFVIFSIMIIWTTKPSTFNRVLLFVNHVLFFFIAIILIVSSIYPFFEYSPECSIDEDKTIYFNFDIPTSNGATKNSHKILSTCSANLFDSPNDDILLGEFGSFKNLKTFILNWMRQFKEEDNNDNNRKTKDTIRKKITNNWLSKKEYIKKLRGLSDNKCSSSQNVVDKYIEAFDAIVNKTDDYIAALNKREDNWDELETKVETAVNKHVKDVSGMVIIQITKINDGIKILNINCQTTRTLFTKINQMQCSNHKTIGFIALFRSLVSFATGLCMIYFIFIYRKFGPTYETSSPPSPVIMDEKEEYSPPPIAPSDSSAPAAPPATKDEGKLSKEKKK